MDNKSYFFYVLKCQDGSLYGGFTNDVLRRLMTHNRGEGAKYTRSRRPVHLIYFERFTDKSRALSREYWFKHHSRAFKLRFLHDHHVEL